MSPARMSKLESSMRVVLAFNEAFNRHDLDAITRLVGDACNIDAFDAILDGTSLQGKPAANAFWNDFFRAAPNARFDIEEIFGIGERCVVRWKSNLHAAGGETQALRGADIFKVRDGLILEQLSYIHA